MPPSQRRVTLTKSQLSSTVGTKLVNLLKEVAEDGTLTDDEIQKLRNSLQDIKEDEMLPSVVFLKEILHDVLVDGKIDNNERYALIHSICRVLPKEEREKVAPKIKYQYQVEPELATDKQKKFITDLGGTYTDTTTISEASEIIERLLENRPTNRQIMVLRFWNRLDMMNCGVDAVSAWLDDFYGEDSRRKQAWELWKKENGDDGGKTHERIEKVQIGIGDEYLRRLDTKTPTISEASDGYKGLQMLFAVIAVVLVIVLISAMAGGC